MDRKQLKWKLRYYWQYFPFTINTVLYVVAAWASFKLLYKPVPNGEYPSPFLPFVILMGKLTLWFVVALGLVSMFSTLAAYFYFTWLRESNKTALRVDFSLEESAGKLPRLFLTASIDGIFRPILGFVKGRLYYDDNILTDSFGLLTNKRKPNSLRRAAITGKSRLYLPDIKEYDLKGGFIYFQDMLHVFSLASAHPLQGHFYQPPVLKKGHDADAQPKTTETMEVRIDQLRRVDGEYLNYKDFESGDDVRRIVWKVYAKNRELVVRVPEMYEPFASHLYFYASFHARLQKQWLNDDYAREMLNHYKNCVWTIYDALGKKDWEVRFIPDQQISLSDQMSEAERTARTISNSTWHADRSLLDYFNPSKGAVLCISSFSDPAEVAELLEKCSPATIVYFVRVSTVLRSYAPLRWISRLIFLPPEDRLSRLRATWPFAPLNFKLRKNEKELVAVLNRSSVTWGEI